MSEIVRVLELVETERGGIQGLSTAEACEKVGVPRWRYYRWRREHPEIVQRLQRPSFTVAPPGPAARLRETVADLRSLWTTAVEDHRVDPTLAEEVNTQICLLEREIAAAQITEPEEPDTRTLSVQLGNKLYGIRGRGGTQWLFEQLAGSAKSLCCAAPIYWACVDLLDRLAIEPEGHSFDEIVQSLQHSKILVFKDYEVRVCLRLWMAKGLVKRKRYRYRCSGKIQQALGQSGLPGWLSEEPDWLSKRKRF